MEGSHIIIKTVEKRYHSNTGNVIGNINKTIPILLENKIWLTRLVEWGLQFFLGNWINYNILFDLLKFFQNCIYAFAAFIPYHIAQWA